MPRILCLFCFLFLFKVPLIIRDKIKQLELLKVQLDQVSEWIGPRAGSEQNEDAALSVSTQ